MREVILEGMERAFFAVAFAAVGEEHGESWSGVEIFDVLPKRTDAAATHAAETLAADMERANGAPVEVLFQRHAGGLDATHFGHYAAMSAMGQGVGLWEYDTAVTVPHVEFGSHSLQKDYF